MPLEIAHRTRPAMGLEPPERRLGPLIGPGAPESRIDPFRMRFEIVDQGDGGRDAVRIDRFGIGLTGDHPADMQNERQSGRRSPSSCSRPTQMIGERGIGQLCIEGIHNRIKAARPCRVSVMEDGTGRLGRTCPDHRCELHSAS